MTGPPLAILGSGLVSGVGLSAPASCAAIRCGIANFRETRFIDTAGEPIIGSPVALDPPCWGQELLLEMLRRAVQECAAGASASPGSLPLLLCVAERDRPGRTDRVEYELFAELQQRLAYRFHPSSTILPHGRVSIVAALIQARKLIYDQNHPRVLVAAADSLLVRGSLDAYEEQERLLTGQNSNGFIPGEAAAAVLLGRPDLAKARELLCTGIGVGAEPAALGSGAPLRGDGLTRAFKAALADAECEMHDMSYRITDNSGEQYYFKEAALAYSRTVRRHVDDCYMWHPADCIGEVGAAIGPVILAVAKAATDKGYAYGPNILFHCGNDGGRRGAAVLRLVTRTVA
jgi:3-oxoacyl-[acyl-carrier-protein] synthase I